MTDNTLNMDGMLRLSLMGGQARAFLCQSTRLVQDAQNIHHLSRVATAALGRLLTGASMMGAMLKGENESLTVYHQGRRPASAPCMAVGKADGCVKGYVGNPGYRAAAAPPTASCPWARAVGKNGQPHRGQGSRPARAVCRACVNLRLRRDRRGSWPCISPPPSRLPSLVSLGVLTGERVEAAGGLIIQMHARRPARPRITVHRSERAGMFMDICRHHRASIDLKGAVQQLLIASRAGDTSTRIACRPTAAIVQPRARGARR